MLALVVSVLMAAGLALVVVGAVQSRQPATDAAAYLQSLDDEDHADEFGDKLAEPFIGRVIRPLGEGVAGVVGRATPVAQRDRIRHQIVLAGLSASLRAEDFIVMQVLSAVGGVVLGILYVGFGPGSSHLRLLVLLLLVAAGILSPQSWLRRKVDERKESIFLDLPDVLDLLAISVEAGVGFEGALDIVCKHFSSPLAEEFSRTLKEMELGLPRREALQNLKRRTEVPELSNFVLALVQADALGMPIGRVLHTQAGEMRLKRRQWAREKAGKLPVKILFPLVLFIFPAVLIVILGPAGSTIGKSLR
jgi:tight adherence protein C